MGNDGGSIPRRAELVKQKKKKEKVDPILHAISIWFFCALSKVPLSNPIVVDEVGKLYNREAILKHLLDPNGSYGDADQICAYIKSIKDVKTLKLTSNPGYEAKKAHASVGQVPQFICPILQKEMNGRNRFIANWNCGCVVSEEAIKSVGSEECLNCNKKYGSEDLILINPDESELKDLKVRMKARREKRKLLKKLKADKNKESAGTKHLDSDHINSQSANKTTTNNDPSHNDTTKPELDPSELKKRKYTEHRQDRLKAKALKSSLTAPNSGTLNRSIQASKIIEKYSSNPIKNNS
ncbi:hypothetical protein BB560_006367, partial [Smittium megazygosporum]